MLDFSLVEEVRRDLCEVGRDKGSKQRKKKLDVLNENYIQAIWNINYETLEIYFPRITYIVYPQGIRFALLPFLRSHASVTGTLPPFVIQHLNLSLLLEF